MKTYYNYRIVTEFKIINLIEFTNYLYRIFHENYNRQGALETPPLNVFIQEIC